MIGFTAGRIDTQSLTTAANSQRPLSVLSCSRHSTALTLGADAVRSGSTSPTNPFRSIQALPPPY